MQYAMTARNGESNTRTSDEFSPPAIIHGEAAASRSRNLIVRVGLPSDGTVVLPDIFVLHNGVCRQVYRNYKDTKSASILSR